MLQFTPGYPPYVAVAVGAKCAQHVATDLAGLCAPAQRAARHSIGPSPGHPPRVLFRLWAMLLPGTS